MYSYPLRNLTAYMPPASSPEFADDAEAKAVAAAHGGWQQPSITEILAHLEAVHAELVRGRSGGENQAARSRAPADGDTDARGDADASDGDGAAIAIASVASSAAESLSAAERGANAAIFAKRHHSWLQSSRELSEALRYGLPWRHAR